MKSFIFWALANEKLILETKAPVLIAKQNKMENIQNKVQTLLNDLQEEQKVLERADGAETNFSLYLYLSRVSKFLGVLDSSINLYLLQEREKKELKTQRDLLAEEIAQHVAVQETQKKSIEKLNGQLEAYHAIQEVVEKQMTRQIALSREPEEANQRNLEIENKEPEEQLVLSSESETDSDDCGGGDEKRAEVERLWAVNLNSIKDRIKHMNHDPQQFDNKDLISIGKKMAEYFRAYTGNDPQKKEEKINDKHNSFVCVYGEPDWEHLDYLITTTLKIQQP